MTAQPPHGSQPGPQYGSQPGAPLSRRPAGEAGFFKSLFDLKFENFVTVRFAAVIYVISIVLAVLGYLGTVIWGFGIGMAGGAMGGYASSFGYSTGMGAMGVLVIIGTILLGWIPYFIQIIFTRVLIEFVVANVRTAQNTQRLVERR